ncbi:MAG: CxxxxCH/CxxCH domain c-type cytochrome, partial [Nitrospirota bacterium]
MKKSTILVISILVGLFGISFAVRDALALDAPHNTNDSVGWPITCSQCHYPAASVPTWATLPTGTDTTFKNNLCTSCHSGNTLSSSRFNDVKTHSADNTGSSYWGGAWTVECIVCHNPHAQPQVPVVDPDVNVLTGTVATLTSTYGAVQSSLTTTVSLAADYTDYLLIPNIAYPTRIYRIASNTNNTITVTGAINLNYTAAGKTFAIRYGKMVPTALSYPSKGISASVKFFNKTGADSFAAPGAASTAICQVCHTQTTSFNRNGTQESGAHPAGVAGTQACTDCHAHSSGFKIGGCTGCHGSPPSNSGDLVFLSRLSVSVTSDSPGAGAHVKHTSSGFGCDNCHASGMLGGATQGDDKINIKFNLNATDLGGNYDGKSGRTVYPYLGGAPTTVSAGNSLQCSNIYCHSTAQAADGGAGAPTYRTPTWTGTVVCGDCHDADGVQGNATLMSTGSHTKHLAAAVGANCDSCHSGATHVNRNIEVANSYTASAQGAPGNGYGSCSAATCHQSPYAASMVATPTWGTASGCNACHSTNPITATGPNTGGHAQHNDTNCVDCHNAGTTAASSPSTGHADGDIDVTNGYPVTAKHAAGTYVGTCSTASCHSDVYGTGTAVTPVWGSTGSGCTACHSVAIAATGPNTGSHAKHNDSTCTDCHNAGTTATSKPTTSHADGSIDVTNGYPVTAKHAVGSYTGTCSTASCHASPYGS